MRGCRAQQGLLSAPFGLGQHLHSQAQKWRNGSASVPWRFAEASSLEVTKESQVEEQKSSRKTWMRMAEMKPEVGMMMRVG